MSNNAKDQNLATPWAAAQDDHPQQPAQYAQPFAQTPQQQAPSGAAVTSYNQPGLGPVGKIRGSGVAILLSIVTLGFYSIYWMCATHSEMKRHSGQGFGGVAAFFLSFVPFLMTFLTPSEVGNLYTRTNRHSPVSGATGFWTLVPFVGAFIWFFKVNGALNDYWRSMGAVER